MKILLRLIIKLEQHKVGYDNEIKKYCGNKNNLLKKNINLLQGKIKEGVKKIKIKLCLTENGRNKIYNYDIPKGLTSCELKFWLNLKSLKDNKGQKLKDDIKLKEEGIVILAEKKRP